MFIWHTSSLFCQDLLHQRKLLPPTVHKMLVPYRKTFCPSCYTNSLVSSTRFLVETVSFLAPVLFCHTPCSLSVLIHVSQQHSLPPPNSLKNCKQHDYLHEKPTPNLQRQPLPLLVGGGGFLFVGFVCGVFCWFLGWFFGGFSWWFLPAHNSMMIWFCCL